MQTSLWIGAVAYDPKVVTIWEGMRSYLRSEGELDAIGEEARQEVLQAVERARAGPPPDPATVLEYVYSAPSLAEISG
jgi:TPP-dependent pyruvate/acetoin dehydrogenase alpha subunit